MDEWKKFDEEWPKEGDDIWIYGKNVRPNCIIHRNFFYKKLKPWTHWNYLLPLHPQRNDMKWINVEERLPTKGDVRYCQVQGLDFIVIGMYVKENIWLFHTFTNIMQIALLGGLDYGYEIKVTKWFDLPPKE